MHFFLKMLCTYCDLQNELKICFFSFVAEHEWYGTIFLLPCHKHHHQWLDWRTTLYISFFYVCIYMTAPDADSLKSDLQVFHLVLSSSLHNNHYYNRLHLIFLPTHQQIIRTDNWRKMRISTNFKGLIYEIKVKTIRQG